MGDVLSPQESQLVQPGQVVVNIGLDVWKTWANASSVTGAVVGVVLIGGLPGNTIQVVTLGRFPSSAFNLGPGNASDIVAGNKPSRGTSGLIMGTCDASGELFVLPTTVGQASATFTGVPSVGTVASLRTTQPTPANSVYVQAYSTLGDGGGGLFDWFPNDTRTDDGATILQITGTATGRWVANTGGAPINARRFGVVCDGITVSDGAMSSSVNPTVLACTTSLPFTSQNATPGKPIVVVGAGNAGTPLVTTINSFTDSGHVVLNNPCLTTVSSARVNSATDSTTAINAMITALSTVGGVTAQAYLPGMCGASSQIAMTATANGITLKGNSKGDVNVPRNPSGIMALASMTSLIKYAGNHCVFDTLWFSGSNLTTGGVLELTYSSGPAEETMFVNCAFTNTKSNTGYIHNYTGTLQVVKLVFESCEIRQDPASGTDYCAAWINNPNGNAFGIDYRNCIFYNANTTGVSFQATPGGTFPAGACNFYVCEFYVYNGPIFSIECARGFTLQDCYTEGGSFPFIQEFNNTPGFWWQEAVVAETTQMLTSGNPIGNNTLQLLGKQPIAIKHCTLEGPIRSAGTGPFVPVIDNCYLVPYDFAVASLNTVVVDNPQFVRFIHCPIVYGQTAPNDNFYSDVKYWDHDPQQGYLDVRTFGAYGGARTTSDANVTVNTNILQSGTANFTVLDTNKVFAIYNDSSGTFWNAYAVKSVINSTTIVASANFNATAANCIFNLGGTQNLSDSGAIQNAANTASTLGKAIRFHSGNYMLTSTNAANCPVWLESDANFIVTGAGASGANAIFQGPIKTDHNPVASSKLTNFNTGISPSFASYFKAQGGIDTTSSVYKMNATGNFDQTVGALGYNARFIQLSDPSAFLGANINLFLPQSTGSGATVFNNTSVTVVVKPELLSLGVTIGPGKRQTVYFDGTQYAPAGANA